MACEYTRGTGFPPPSSRPASKGRRASVAAVSSALRSFTCDRSCRLAGCSGTTPAECGEGTPGLCRQRYAAVHRELLPVCRRPWRSSDRVPSALSLRGALRRLDGPPIGGQGKLHRVELDCRFRRLSLQVDNFPPGPRRRVDDWGVFLELRSCPCFSVLSICPRAGSRSCRSCVAPLVFALLSRRRRRGSHGQLDWSGPFTSARVSRRGVLRLGLAHSHWRAPPGPGRLFDGRDAFLELRSCSCRSCAP